MNLFWNFSIGKRMGCEIYVVGYERSFFLVCEWEFFIGVLKIFLFVFFEIYVLFLWCFLRLHFFRGQVEFFLVADEAILVLLHSQKVVSLRFERVDLQNKPRWGWTWETNFLSVLQEVVIFTWEVSGSLLWSASLFIRVTFGRTCSFMGKSGKKRTLARSMNSCTAARTHNYKHLQQSFTVVNIVSLPRVEFSEVVAEHSLNWIS